MKKLLQNRVAVVTGAAQGIGEEITSAFADHGADVIIADINLEKAESVAENVKKYGVKSLAVRMDVTDKNDIAEKNKKILDCFNKIDIWVNNAGIAQEKPIEDISEAEWDKMLDIDLKSMFLCCQQVYGVMKTQNSGKIINISSLAGQRGGHFAGAHYSAAKGGVLALTKSMALNFGKYNINVNTIAPGLILTKMAESLGWDKKTHNNIPLGRLGTVRDVANAAVFLASELSDYITGETIDVNGGIVMR